jgi:hypothetical protein
MTEAEWLACEDPQEMLDLFSDVRRSRKRRRLACACHLRAR